MGGGIVVDRVDLRRGINLSDKEKERLDFTRKNEEIYKRIKEGEGPVTGLEPLVDKGVIESGPITDKRRYKFKK